MKIFIVGASGRIGTKLANYLADQGHTVIAGSRHPQAFESENITSIEFDLHDSVENLAKKVGKVDAIYFVAGSRSKDLLQTDAYGPVKLAQVATENGITRFILLSSIFATQPDHWNDDFLAQIPDYNIAKYFADRWIIDHSKLNYTILQPGALLEEPATNKIDVYVKETGKNSIDDVVTVLGELLELKNSYKKVVPMHSGSLPINQALSDI
ncbi:NAD(P)H-binding protein [Pediococcus argentinicus]|uniref:NAD(P)H-binding protein n=1 Tax=Pediococcus argentinicus TaxID=480391 RepID=UPI00338F0117